jgi:ubiquinone biosynthesis protein
MSIFTLRQTIGDLKRFRDILSILFEEGLSFALAELNLLYLVPMRSRLRRMGRRSADDARGFAAFGSVGADGRIDPPLEVRLRRAFERLGPTFIKLGQVMSLRPDLLPERYVHELAKLQDRVEPLAAGVAEKAVEAALGAPIENVFAEFDPEPLAAASLSVVHRAALRDGTQVAVKVQRPRVAEIVRKDISILAYLARLIEEHVPASRAFRPTEFAAEFADWTMRELDFELEATNMDRFRHLFTPEERVVIPGVHWDHVRREVLVMEYVPGIKIDDLAGLRAAGVDCADLAKLGVQAGLRMFMFEGFFHADPHPGNMVALPAEVGGDGEVVRPLRLAFYDCGMTGTLTERVRYELLSCFMSFVNRDIEAYTRHILDLAEPGSGADEAGFLRDARRAVTDVLYKPNARKGVALAFYRVLLSGARHDLRFPTDLVLMGKAFFTIEQTGLRLHPDIDLGAVLRPYLQRLMLDELSPRRLSREMAANLFDRLYFLKHLPEQTRAMLGRLEQGEVGVKINLDELHDLKREFDRQNDVRVLGLLTAVVFVGSALALRLDERLALAGVPLGPLGMGAALVMLVWVWRLANKRPKA